MCPEKGGFYTAHSGKLCLAAAVIAATAVVAAVITAEAGKQNDPDNPVTAIVAIAAQDRITASAAIVAAVITVAEEK